RRQQKSPTDSRTQHFAASQQDPTRSGCGSTSQSASAASTSRSRQARTACRPARHRRLARPLGSTKFAQSGEPFRADSGVPDVPLVLVANQELRRPELDDLTLARAQRGEEPAWRALVERYQRPVFALLSRMLSPVARRDLVEDLAQETFLRAFRALP